MQYILMLFIWCFVAIAAPAVAGPPKSTARAKSAADARTDARIDARNDAKERQKIIANVNSWAIQLRFLNRADVAASPLDLVVIDHAPHPIKNTEIPFTPADIAPMKIKPGGGRRLVFAYLSMGEAENYRHYWQPAWDMPASRPAWLGAENPRWPGNYQVRFADPDWQSVIFGRPGSVLDRIIAAGFDGVYLDRVDAFQDVEATMPGAGEVMEGFVARLADHARRANPRFLIVMQNAEELLRSKSLVARLDGVSKEDLLYGNDNSDLENPQQMVRDTIGYLGRARKAGLKVLMLEYASKPDQVAAARKLAQREGYVLHFTERMLGTLSINGRAGTAASVPVAAP